MRFRDVTALGRLCADVFECWGAITRNVDTSIHRVVGIHSYRRKCEFGEGTADGRSSQIYKDLVACADNTVVLTETGSDPERISNHSRVVSERER